MSSVHWGLSCCCVQLPLFSLGVCPSAEGMHPLHVVVCPKFPRALTPPGEAEGRGAHGLGMSVFV